jgi:hypothetical protein
MTTPTTPATPAPKETPAPTIVDVTDPRIAPPSAGVARPDPTKDYPEKGPDDKPEPKAEPKHASHAHKE